MQGSGCTTCNPICGICQPAKIKPVQCPECETHNVYKREAVIAKEPLPCRSCGRDLTDQAYNKPVYCNYCGLLCAYACGRGQDPTPEKGFQECKHNLPPLDDFS